MSGQSEKRLNNLDFSPNGLEKVMSISPSRVPFEESYLDDYGLYTKV
jgi:hypothetical protein